VSDTDGLQVGYLVSQYPALSHSFIEREVLALRSLGARVETFSVQQPPEQLSSAVMRAEAADTLSVQGDVRQVVNDNARALGRAPLRYLRSLGKALRFGDNRLKARIWQVFYFVEAARIQQVMARRGLRHLHVHFANNGADIARLVVELGRALDGPDAGWSWSFTMHGPTEFEAVDRYDLASKIGSANGVACIADFTRSQLMRLSDPSHWPKFELVRMGVDTDRYRPPAEPRRHSGPMRILDVGRLVPEKGGPVLVEAVRILLDSGIDVEVRFVGAGPLQNDFERMIADRGLTDRVRLIGPVGQDDMLEQYHWADVFCLPSFQEGLPVVLMEAMATEVPVVTTQIAGIGELVTDGVNGRLLPAGRADLIADAIADLQDAGLRARMGAAGRQRVVEEFTVIHNAVRQRDFLAHCAADVR
jgi:colanic acid/amylovoran biosynthesis glycosyltransferase